MPLVKLFLNIILTHDLQNLENEWHEFRALEHNTIFTENKIESMKIKFFWNTIFALRKSDETKMFPSLEELIASILSLPNSNGSVER